MRNPALTYEIVRHLANNARLSAAGDDGLYNAKLSGEYATFFMQAWGLRPGAKVLCQFESDLT